MRATPLAVKVGKAVEREGRPRTERVRHPADAVDLLDQLVLGLDGVVVDFGGGEDVLDELKTGRSGKSEYRMTMRTPRCCHTSRSS